MTAIPVPYPIRVITRADKSYPVIAIVIAGAIEYVDVYGNRFYATDIVQMLGYFDGEWRDVQRCGADTDSS